jgi:hypothetical protein
MANGNTVTIENFSIHFDIETYPGGKGAGEIRDEIFELASQHEAIVKARTSVVRDGAFKYKLGE